MSGNDKGIPSWLVFLFFGSIVVGVIYGSYVHGFARERTPLLSGVGGSGFVVALPSKPPRSAAAEAAGQQSSATCAACHGVGLKGGAAGPSLMDAEWLHGANTETQLHRLIVAGISSGLKFGNKNSPMPAMGSLGSEADVWNVVYYLSKENPSIKKDAD